MDASLLIVTCLCMSLSSASSSNLPLGIHPLDEKYFSTEVIKCKDGSNSFPRDRLNDNFCDCPDGTDEPGTSACPAGKFYCKNLGSTPQFLFSSRVNDYICDCCDGSDEYDGSVNCPNTCILGGNIVYQKSNYHSTIRNSESTDGKKMKNEVNPDSKLTGLKVVIILQVLVIIFVVAFRLFRRCVKTKRRHPRSDKFP